MRRLRLHHHAPYSDDAATAVGSVGQACALAEALAEGRKSSLLRSGTTREGVARAGDADSCGPLLRFGDLAIWPWRPKQREKRASATTRVMERFLPRIDASRRCDRRGVCGESSRSKFSAHRYSPKPRLRARETLSERMAGCARPGRGRVTSVWSLESARCKVPGHALGRRHWGFNISRTRDPCFHQASPFHRLLLSASLAFLFLSTSIPLSLALLPLTSSLHSRVRGTPVLRGLDTSTGDRCVFV
jgi:hypothetical protein